MTAVPVNPTARLLDLAFRLRVTRDLAEACSRSLPVGAPRDVVARVEGLLADCVDAVARECREAEGEM